MNLGTMFTFALAGGACVLVGKAVGKGDYEQARRVFQDDSGSLRVRRRGDGDSRFPAAQAVCFASTAQRGPSVVALATKLIAIGAVTLLGTSVPRLAALSASTAARATAGSSTTVDLICGWLVVLPADAAGGVRVQAGRCRWCILCTRIDQCFKWIIAFFRLRGNKWMKNVTRSA